MKMTSSSPGFYQKKTQNPTLRSEYTTEIFPVLFLLRTSKHKSSENSYIPPLTPPPSYYTNNSSKKHSRSKLLLHNLLRRMNPMKKSNLESSSPHSSSSSSISSLSWSSSAHSSFSDPITTPSHIHKRRRFSSRGSSLDAKSVDVPRGEVCCFGIRKDNGERIHGGGYSGLIVKKPLLPIVGRGSA